MPDLARLRARQRDCEAAGGQRESVSKEEALLALGLGAAANLKRTVGDTDFARPLTAWIVHCFRYRLTVAKPLIP